MTDSLDVDNVQDVNPVDIVVNESGESQKDDANQKTVFNNEQVQKIVTRERLKAYEKGKREAMQELNQGQEQVPQQAPMQQQQQAPMQQQSLGGMPQLSQADIEQMIAEKTPQFLQDHINQIQTSQVVNAFVDKMRAAEERYPGLEERLNDLDYGQHGMTGIVQMANNLENTGDIMHELTSNPMKMGTLVSLMQTQPKLAQKAMMELSNSIKQNQDALAQNQSARDPLSQIKPSTGGVDKGEMSVSDFRKMFKA